MHHRARLLLTAALLVVLSALLAVSASAAVASKTKPPKSPKPPKPPKAGQKCDPTQPAPSGFQCVVNKKGKYKLVATS